MKWQEEGTFLFLGTGSSMGVPVVGCQCAVCRSNDPRNQRLRPSGLLYLCGKRILVDAGPDFRLQALRHDIDTIDGVILTHSHHDHTAGIDDLRVYSMGLGEALPLLCSDETLSDMKKRYSYIFDSNHPYQLATRVEVQRLASDRGKVNFLGVCFHYTSFYQSGMKVLGLRLGDFAYVSDIREYSETIFEDLMGVKTLVVSALRFEPTRMHFSVDEAITFSKRVGAKMTWLTHISHDLEHGKTNASLPSNVQMAYDGLSIHI